MPSILSHLSILYICHNFFFSFKYKYKCISVAECSSDGGKKILSIYNCLSEIFFFFCIYVSHWFVHMVNMLDLLHMLCSHPMSHTSPPSLSSQRWNRMVMDNIFESYWSSLLQSVIMWKLANFTRHLWRTSEDIQCKCILLHVYVLITGG